MKRIVLALALLSIWMALPALGHGGHPGGDHALDLDHSIGGEAEFHRQRTYDAEFGPENNTYSCQSCHNGADLGDGWINHGGRRDASHNHQFAVEKTRTFPTFFHLFRGGKVETTVDMLHLWDSWMGPPALPEMAGDVEIVSRAIRPLFGIARIEDIPDAVILANADPFDEDGDGISGRVAREPFTGRVARFGWQPIHADLTGFAIAGMQVEFGYDLDELRASPRLQRELTEIADFVRSLPVPRPRLRFGSEAERAAGEALFHEMQCSSCHIQNLGNAQNLWSDLLLHDLGPQVNDSIGFGTATPRESRTPPLQGLWPTGQLNNRMRDGTASGLFQIMQRHGGEAEASRKLFEEGIVYPHLQEMIVFLGSL